MSYKSFIKNVAKRWSSLRSSIYLFPAVLTLLLLLLTSLRISGSSVGIYSDFLNGTPKDSHLIFAKPQPIRSDEWLVNTQLTIAQARSGFPRINHNITGDGRDMSLDIDVPYKEWSTIFKPQNLAFLFLPLEVAFAFKWWLILYLLIISIYFFVLRLFPGKRLFAAVAAIGFSCSPFVFWWYQSITLGSLFYGFFILTLGMRILRKEPVKLLTGRAFSQNVSRVLYVILATYLLVSFALLFYPPFQIPVAIAVTLFLAGYALSLRWNENYYKNIKQLLQPIAIFTSSVVLTGLIGLVFMHTRQAALMSVEHTVYPGARVVASGGFELDRLLGTYVQPELQRSLHGPHYYTNQSESSNFILLVPYLLIPGLILTAYQWLRSKRPPWTFIAIQISVLLFLANMLVPGGQSLYHLLLLDKVPHERLLLGLGFVGFLQLMYLIKNLDTVHVPRKYHPTIVAAVYSALCLVIFLMVGHFTREHFPLFIRSWTLIACGSALFSLIIFLLLVRQSMIALVLVACFSFASVCYIHPLYQGLGPIADNSVTRAMDTISKPHDTWVSLDQIYIENFGLLANRNSLTGVQFYPDLAFWRQLGGKANDYIDNRYAHVLFTANPDFPPISLVQMDSFMVHFECSPFIEQHVNFVLSLQPLSFACTKQTAIVRYPSQTFYMYKIQSP